MVFQPIYERTEPVNNNVDRRPDRLCHILSHVMEGGQDSHIEVFDVIGRAKKEVSDNSGEFQDYVEWSPESIEQ